MSDTKSNKLCAVCKTQLTVRTTTAYLGDPMHMICGPGSKNQMTKTVSTFCGDCGLIYVNGGGIDSGHTV